MKKGFISLIIILIIGAMGIMTAVSVLLLGLGSSRTSFSIEQSKQSKGLANACAEEALERIRLFTPFTGSGSLSLGQGNCTYTVTSLGGPNRLIISTGTIGSNIRKVRIIIDRINPRIRITSWQEVSDF